MAGGLTALHLLIGLTPLYELIVGSVIGAPEEVIALSRQGFLILTPWTASIAYRRLWQGVLIRFNRTKVVPITIGARLITTTSTLLFGLFVGTVPGVYIGTAGLSLGVVAAAVVSYAFVRPTLQAQFHSASNVDAPLSWADLFSFYVPLALTSLIVLANQPLFTTSLSRAPLPLLSLAVWPVMMSVLFLGRSIALSFQEAVVALLHDSVSYAQLRRFAWTITAILGGIFLLFALTPLSRFWYTVVAGLTPEMVRFALIPTLLLAPIPAISTLISWQRGILVSVKQTRYITHSVGISVTVLVLVLLVATPILPFAGVVTAALGLTLSVSAEWLYLWWRSHAIAKQAGYLTQEAEKAAALAA